MIRFATPPDSTPAWHAGFLALLPAIVRQASRAFRHLRPEARQDAIEEVIANSMVAYARLVEMGKADIAYPSPLARYGIRQTKDGRKVGMRLNVRDLSSMHCQKHKGVTLERLDRFDRDEGRWLEVLVEDRRAGPAETAAARIDLSDWLRLLPSRDRKIAGALAVGGTTGEVAKRFRLSPARISQKRREYRESWNTFQGEATDDEGVQATVA